MHERIMLILGLLFMVFLLVMLARKIRIAYPVFLVLAGLAISFIPGLPRLHLDPEVIFLIFLPPLLYEAAWYTSWNDFWKWKRPIILLAFGLVFFTSSIVACITSSIIPGFTVALGFLLGGIVSPPDAVAATTVLKDLTVPRRLLAILEGESLVNDASSLIVFRFALAAVLTGTFSIQEASLQFALVTSMGVVIGLAGAHLLYVVHRFLPTTPAIDAALTIMTPYSLFLAAEHFHFSGVMAVVSGGLFLSWRSHEVFRTGNTRLNMLGAWTTMIFVMNALVFILIGLALPEIVEGLGEYSIAEGIKYGLLISAVVIVLRILWIYPTAFVPRWLSARVRQDPPPGWKGPLVIGWAGMRGVVSLATALSIPLYLSDGVAFPHRNLIVFITFIVIFVTLVLQGLTLPLLIRLIGLKEIDRIAPEEEQEAGIQLNLDKIALSYINEHYAAHVAENELLQFLRSSLENNISANQRRLESLECDATEMHDIEVYRRLLSEVYAEQRKELFRLRKYNLFNDEEIRKAELQLDLNDLKIRGAGD
ncbi:Na+/H+ antiporter [Arcticibacter tournemirensis]|uniref:Na+/H+ antiporter n=2 Tax=Pseudomonadati TaxID=3379134 RepID=A0A4Q0M6H9_9SPHI|nr:Na+/H+ antiporter [Arcticibacter tournemirensis]RXF68661.1 Na+/H+ antiporter [Arcticibacter tournemirensis]